MRTFAVTRDLARAIALALLFGANLIGCSQNNPQPPQSTATTTVNNPPATAPIPGPNSTASGPATNDVNAGPGGATGANTAVADAVNKAIHTNVQLTGSRITAVVDPAGVATLTGTAQDQQQKALAVRAATNTTGVTSVKDKIEIVPTGGAKEKQVTKVIHETKVIVLPSSPNSTQSGNGSAGNATGSGNGSGTGSTSTNTNTSSSSQAPAGGGTNNPPASGAQ